MTLQNDSKLTLINRIHFELLLILILTFFLKVRIEIILKFAYS